MGFFGIPWLIAMVYIAGFVCVPIAIEIIIHSKWWKRQSDYYYSFNKKTQ